MAASKVTRDGTGHDWEHFGWSELLEVRLCDLGLAIEGSWLEDPIQRLREELEARELRVRPHFWLSEEWFCPDGVPGVAIPFYLAHPRGVSSLKLDGRVVDGSVVQSVAAFIDLWAALTLIGMLGFAAYGLDLFSALSASAATLGNVGPGFAAFGASSVLWAVTR